MIRRQAPWTPEQTQARRVLWNPRRVPVEPTQNLNDSHILTSGTHGGFLRNLPKTLTIHTLSLLEPTVGSCGTYRFYNPSNAFATFYASPRALIIILIISMGYRRQRRHRLCVALASSRTLQQGR